jgi:hypothetical protein
MSGMTRLLMFCCLAVLASRVDAQFTVTSIEGKLWRDYNGNGIRDADEESLGIADRPVELWSDDLATMLMETVTDANGRYEFRRVGAPASRYRVRVRYNTSAFTLSPRYVGDDRGIDSDFYSEGDLRGYTNSILAFPGSPVRSIDGGLDPVDIRIGNFTWIDLDNDGVQDAGELGLPDIVVELWSADRTTFYASATSDANGLYEIYAPGYGSFRIRYSLPAGLSFSPKNATADTQLDSDVIPTGADRGWTDLRIFPANLISITSIDAGYWGPNAVDVALEFTNVPTVVYPGGMITWRLWVSERLQRSVGSVRIRSEVPMGMSEFSWQCTGQGGATCPASGLGAVDLTPSLPVGGVLRFDFAARVGLTPSIFVSTASAEVASPQNDMIVSNNLAQALIRNDRIFRGGFDLGG